MGKVIIDGCNVAEERKFLIHNICYDLTLKIQRAKEENERYRKALEDIRARIKQYHLKVGGEVVGADTIFDIEKKISEVLDECEEK